MLLAPLGLAATTGVPARTCARIVSRRGMPRLADVDRVTGEARRRGPVTPVRYERERPAPLAEGGSGGGLSVWLFSSRLRSGEGGKRVG